MNEDRIRFRRTRNRIVTGPDWPRFGAIGREWDEGIRHTVRRESRRRGM